MSDFIIIDSDEVHFNSAFQNAFIMPEKGKITGTGGATLKGKKVCIDGDETSVKVQNVTYISPPYVDGKCTLLIDKLGNDQVADHTNSNQKKVILKGTVFDAVFEVTKPGIDPAGNLDPNLMYSGGTGFFKTNNTKFKGT
ncbi:hypothetical protein BKI52_10000 [marine bacterium AO1-C]|nr:hypothetical protein BKI52_10000 [marine bacterium AO1-C]